MATPEDRRFRVVVQALRAAGFEPVIIGAVAMIPHGYTRATRDIDLMVWDRAAYQPSVWASVERVGRVELRETRDDDDPVLAVARIGARSLRPIDVVMPRGAWHRDAIERAFSSGPKLERAGVVVSAVTLPDLIVMKLESGGIPARNDVIRLLEAAADRRTVEAAVVATLPHAPREARRSWDLLKAMPE